MKVYTHPLFLFVALVAVLALTKLSLVEFADKRTDVTPTFVTFDYSQGVTVLAKAEEGTHNSIEHICAGGHVISLQREFKKGFAYPLYDMTTSLPLKCSDYDIETYLKHSQVN